MSRRRDSLLPEKQLVAVVTALYSDADVYGWAHLPPTEHTRLYAQWINDPRIGKILTRYMTPEQARSWIKDGPMKEYSNALRGVGRYARFGRQGGTTANDIAVAALGRGANVVDESEGVKPPHCRAEDAAGDEAYLAWGYARNFRNLLWAALRAAVVEKVPAHIIVLEPPGYTTPTADRTIHERMIRRCRLQLHYMPEVLGRAERRGISDA
jgi:hypothetical protein